MQLSAEERQKLVESGFSEQDIAAYEADQTVQTAPTPVSPEQADTGLPKFSETEIPATAAPPAASGTETAMAGGQAALAALPYLGGGGIAGAALYGGKKFAEGKQAMQQTEQLKQQGMMEREQYRQEQLNQRAQMRMGPAPTAPVSPTQPGQPQPGQFNRAPMQAPQMQAPQAMPQQAPRPMPQAMPPAAPPQPPSAGNFIERMHGLAEKYKTANPVIVKQPVTNKAPAMRTPGGGMEGGTQPIQIQQGPDITPELRRYKEQNIYNTFR